MQIAHSDNRRDLYSFPEAKLIKANEDTVIGKHFHKLKEEIFILSSGECDILTYPINNIKAVYSRNMRIGVIYTIVPNTYHEFHLTKGSVLIGLNSRPYDPTDDYRL